MRRALLLALILGAGPVAAQAQAPSKRATFTCTTDASGAGLTARTERQFDRRGELRSGTTTVVLPLSGAAGTLEARWEVSRGLPEVAQGKYVFRLAAPADAAWQLTGLAKPIRARDGALAVGGEQFRALLTGGAPIRLVLAGRDGRERASASLDQAAFDAALDLARQADARALAGASAWRSCPQGGG